MASAAWLVMPGRACRAYLSSAVGGREEFGLAAPGWLVRPAARLSACVPAGSSNQGEGDQPAPGSKGPRIRLAGREPQRHRLVRPGLRVRPPLSESPGRIRAGPVPRTAARPWQDGPRDRAGRLPDDADDAYHAELGVLAVVLGVHEAGQYPVAGPVADDLLLVGAVGQGVVEVVEAGGQALCLVVLALLQQPGDPERARGGAAPE